MGGSPNLIGTSYSLSKDDNAIKLSGNDGSVSSVLISDILKLAYPVGSIYMSIDGTNPSELFGSDTEWVAWGAGRVPIGVDRVTTGNNQYYHSDVSGGNASHTLTISEMPSHTHNNTLTNNIVNTKNGGFHTHSYSINVMRGTGDNGNTVEAGQVDGDTNTFVGTTDGDGYHTHAVVTDVTITNASAGGGASFSLIQPYVTCYMWRRVS